VPSGAAEAAVGDVVVSQADRWNDVQILPHPGPGRVARNSIDLRRFTLVEQKTGVRMAVQLKRLLLHNKYDQVVEIQMTPYDTDQTWFLDVAMSGQEPTASVASYSPSLDNPPESCGELTARVDPEAATVALFVPDDCLPDDPAVIKVFSSLGHFPQSGVGYALDKMRVRGGHLVHPDRS
jgi:hypothetical protein